MSYQMTPEEVARFTAMKCWTRGSNVEDSVEAAIPAYLNAWEIILNDKVVEAAAVASRHSLWDESEPVFCGFSSESDAQDYGFEAGVEWVLRLLTHKESE